MPSMLARCSRQLFSRQRVCATALRSSTSSHQGLILHALPAAPQQPAQSRMLRSAAVVCGRRSAKIATRKARLANTSRRVLRLIFNDPAADKRMSALQGRSDQLKSKLYGEPASACHMQSGLTSRISLTDRLQSLHGPAARFRINTWNPAKVPHDVSIAQAKWAS